MAVPGMDGSAPRDGEELVKPSEKELDKLRRKTFCDRVVAVLSQVCPVTARAMFGGYGLYVDGTMFGLVAYEALYLKVDDRNCQDYLDLGLEPFTYDRKGEPMQMSYYHLPEFILVDLDRLSVFVERAIAAARRAKARKKDGTVRASSPTSDRKRSTPRR